MYKLEWRHVKKVRLYEQLLLDEVERKLLAQSYDEAFAYYKILLQRTPHLPGLKESYSALLAEKCGHRPRTAAI